MKNLPLDIYDEMPKDMRIYLNNYGWHFNKKAYEYAVNYIKYKKTDNSIPTRVKGYTKDEIDDLLKKYDVDIENKIMYDYVFVATMCKADYLTKSIEDEYHLILYVRDTVDDVDASPETTFRRWVATMVGNGIPIDWYSIC